MRDFLFGILTILPLMIGAPDYPRQVRRIVRWQRTPTARWVFVCVGLVALGLAPLAGVSALTIALYAIVASALMVSMTLYTRWQGLPNWEALCDADAVSNAITLYVESDDESELAGLRCEVKRPKKDEWDKSRTDDKPASRARRYYPNGSEFPNFSGALPAGRYRVVWFAKQGLSEVVVRRWSFRIKGGRAQCGGPILFSWPGGRFRG